MAIGINAIAGYLPEQRLENDELVHRLNVKESFLKEKLGIESRAISLPADAASDLAIRAGEKIFGQGLKKGDVDLLLVCTQNPDYKLPNTASIVQHKLGLSDSLASFDISQGCSGFIYLLAVAKSMMQVLDYQNALLITADPYSKIIEKSDKNTALLFGDAAAAIWVSDESSNTILSFSFGTDGSGFDKLIVKGGGSRHPFSEYLESKEESGVADLFLRMDGRAIFEFMMTRVPVDINKCMEKNGISMEEIDYFIFHQASLYMLKSLQRSMNIPPNKMVYYMKHTGNTVSSSIPLAFENLLQTENLQNKTVLLSGFGVGLAWGSVIIKFN